MTRTWLLRLLAVLLAAVLAVLVVQRTEWVDEDVDRPARGAAADDPNYALAHLVRGFGARFEHRQNLEALPPVGATLLLETSFWDVFPERRDQLRRWVEAGGHLVVDASELDADRLGAWVPLSTHDPARDRRSCRSRASGSAPGGGDADDEDDEGPAACEERIVPLPAPFPASGARSAPLSAEQMGRAALHHCVAYAEPAGVPAAIPGRHAYQLCHGVWVAGLFATRGATPTWSLQGEGRAIAMRVAVGRGSVTATGLLSIESNAGLVRDDNAAFVAALLQLHPGHAMWDVDDETQPVLALWLWQHARPAMLFAALALAAWLWRRAVRFGPRIAPPEAARRSIGDQVAGVAAFLRRHEPQALHRAARRALESLASRHLADFGSADEGARAQAIAAAAGLDAAGLRAAMRPGPLSTPAQWLAASATLEHARRALREAMRPAPRGSP